MISRLIEEPTLSGLLAEAEAVRPSGGRSIVASQASGEICSQENEEVRRLVALLREQRRRRAGESGEPFGVRPSLSQLLNGFADGRDLISELSPGRLAKEQLQVVKRLLFVARLLIQYSQIQ